MPVLTTAPCTPSPQVRAHGFEYVQFVERAVHVTSEFTPPGLPPLQPSPPPSAARCLLGIRTLWCDEPINDQARGMQVLTTAPIPPSQV